MIVIVDYGMGNVRSIQNMLRKVGAKAAVASDPAEIERADKLILPGVGAFDAGMRNLTERGLVPVLNAKAVEAGAPTLGICLGMQLLTRRSEEGALPGLGWIAADTRRFAFDPEHAHLKVPHMGWNHVRPSREHPLFAGLADDARFYFVHSYHAVCDDEASVLARAEYGYEFACGIGRASVLGVQFHPEKSHKFGMQLLRNFAEME